jgi:hypothetical protein
MRAAPVRPHAQALLNAKHQDIALDFEPVVGRALVAVQARDLPVRVHDNALGIRVSGQNLPATRVLFDGRLQVDCVNVDQVFR